MTIVTEEQAKTKWCPFARTITHAEFAKNQPWVAGNRVGGDQTTPYKPNPNPLGSRCIASQCMAWRWSSGMWSLTEQRWIKAGEHYEPGTVEWRDSEYGGCGLAGTA